MVLKESIDTSICKKTKMRLCICILLFIMFSHQSIFAADSSKLPRSFGAIELGMSEEQFSVKLNLQPGDCATCRENEHYVCIYLDKNEAKYFGEEPIDNQDIQRAPMTYLPTSLKPKVVHCYFYKGKLYLINFNGIRSSLSIIRDSYKKILGRPTATDVWVTGISQMRWEDFSTRLAVVYHSAANGLEDFDITYSDRKIIAKMPRDTTK